MARKLRQSRRKAGGYGRGHVSHLRHGWDFFHDGFDTIPNPSMGRNETDYKAMAKAWPILRERVFASHEEHQRLIDIGHILPYGWWRYDAPECLRLKDGEHEPEHQALVLLEAEAAGLFQLSDLVKERCINAGRKWVAEQSRIIEMRGSVNGVTPDPGGNLPLIERYKAVGVKVAPAMPTEAGNSSPESTIGHTGHSRDGQDGENAL